MFHTILFHIPVRHYSRPNGPAFATHKTCHNLYPTVPQRDVQDSASKIYSLITLAWNIKMCKLSFVLVLCLCAIFYS